MSESLSKMRSVVFKAGLHKYQDLSFAMYIWTYAHTHTHTHTDTFTLVMPFLTLTFWVQFL